MFSSLSAIDLPNPMAECGGRSPVVTGFCLLISGMKAAEKNKWNTSFQIKQLYNCH